MFIQYFHNLFARLVSYRLQRRGPAVIASIPLGRVCFQAYQFEGSANLEQSLAWPLLVEINATPK